MVLRMIVASQRFSRYNMGSLAEFSYLSLARWWRLAPSRVPGGSGVVVGGGQEGGSVLEGRPWRHSEESRKAAGVTLADNFESRTCP